MPSVEASLANLELAKLHWRPPRPWRSPQESWQMRHLVWQWFTYPWQKWSARKLALRLGVHRHWVQKLVGEFRRDPAKMVREKRACGFEMATFEQLREGRDETRRMAERGLLRPLYRSVVRELEKDSAVITRSPEWIAKRVEDGDLLPPLRRRVREERKMTWPPLRIPQEIPIWATIPYSLELAQRYREAGLLRLSSLPKKEKATSARMLANAHSPEVMEWVDRLCRDFARRQVGAGGY